MDDETVDIGKETGRITAVFTSQGWSLDINGQVDAMMMFGLAGILEIEANMMHAQNKMMAQQAQRATGLVAARAIPQDHRRKS